MYIKGLVEITLSPIFVSCLLDLTPNTHVQFPPPPGITSQVMSIRIKGMYTEYEGVIT